MRCSTCALHCSTPSTRRLAARRVEGGLRGFAPVEGDAPRLWIAYELAGVACEAEAADGGGVDRRREVGSVQNFRTHLGCHGAAVAQRGEGQGKAIVCQGKAEDMKMMAGLFGEVGMKTTVAAGSAPYK